MADTVQMTLLYDADCGFCTRTVEFMAARARAGVEFTPWQRTDLSKLGLAEAQLVRKAYLIVDGRPCSSGAGAIGTILVACRGSWPILGRICITPPTSWAASAVYALVARNRHRLPSGTASCVVTPR